MANGTGDFNYEVATKTLESLQEYAPTEGELNDVFSEAYEELNTISTKHDGFLSKYLTDLTASGNLYNKYGYVNDEYLRLIDALGTAITEFTNADDDGYVSDDGDTPSGYPTGGGSSTSETSTTPQTTPQTTPSRWIPPEKTTETPTVAPTEAPTVAPTERPTEIITQPTTPPTATPTTPPSEELKPVPKPTPSGNEGNNNGGGNNNRNGGGWYSGWNNNNNNSSSTTNVEKPTTAPTTPIEEDVIKKGNTYKLPTSSKPATTTTTTTTTSNKGNSAIPVLAGLAAAAAAGIGAKAYIDRKNNRDNDEEAENFKAEDWSNNTDVNIEYQEPETQKEETLDFDDNSYEPEETEKYGARTHQELEDLQ